MGCAAGKETPPRTYSNLTTFTSSPCCTGKTGCAANYYQASSAHTCTACAPGGPYNQPTFIPAKAFGPAATMCLNAPGSYSSYYPYSSTYQHSPTPAPLSPAALAANFTASITVTASFNGFTNVAAFETWYADATNQAAMKAGFATAYGVTAAQIEFSNPTASRRRRLTQRRLAAISVTVTVKVQESDKSQVLAQVQSTTAAALSVAIATTLNENNVPVSGFSVSTLQQPVAVAPTPSPTPQVLAVKSSAGKASLTVAAVLVALAMHTSA